MKLGLITTALSLLLVAGTANAEGDAENGARVFNQCRSCHQVGENAKNRTGPILNGIVGSEVATVDGFRYSDAMVTFGEGGTLWDQENLTAFLADPKGIVSGTRMGFRGIRNEEDIVDLIAYLSTFD